MTKYFLILIMSLVSVVSMTANSIIIIEGGDDKVFSVSMDGFQDEIELTIFDWDGEEVYNSMFSTIDAKSKTFDVNALPDGRYVLVIADDLKEKVTPFEVKYNAVNFQTNLSTLTYTPGIQQIGNRVHINTLLDSPTELVVSILNKSDEEVFRAKYEADTSFGKILNFSELPNGFYFVRVSMKDKLFTRKVIIE